MVALQLEANHACLEIRFCLSIKSSLIPSLKYKSHIPVVECCAHVHMPQVYADRYNADKRRISWRQETKLIYESVSMHVQRQLNQIY